MARRHLTIISITLGMALLIGLAVGCGPRGGGREDGTPPADTSRYESRAIEVETVTLERKPFRTQVLSNGRLEAAGHSQVNFKGTGIISRIYVHDGQTVSAGQTLAELDRGDASLSLESARIAMEKAELDLLDVLAGQGYSVRDTASVPAETMAMARIRSGWSSARNSLARAKADLDGCTLKAPFSGKVADLTYHEKDRTGSGPLCAVIDDSSFNVKFTVLESELGDVAVGLPVTVSPFNGTAGTVMGTVTGINPTVGKGGQVEVTARIPSAAGYLDGMNVRVTVERDGARALVVPKSAVVIRDGLEVLFRYSADRAEWVYVHTVGANADSYAVEANAERGASLEEGDEVIVSGNLNLADGSSVVKR